MTLKRQLLLVSVAVVFMALGAGVGLVTARYYAPEEPPGIAGLLWPNPKQLAPFTAVDETGAEFGLARLKGKWSLLFFGYTHCPDICPITLSMLNQVHGKLSGQSADAPQTVFVSVDPARDDAERIAEYVGYFNPAFIGVGGTETQIQSLTRQLGVVSMTLEPDADGDYLVDHSASVFLTDPKGRLVGVFSAPHDAASIAERVRAIREFVNRQDAG